MTYKYLSITGNESKTIEFFEIKDLAVPARFCRHKSEFYVSEEEMLGIVLFAIKSDRANIRWQHCHSKMLKVERQSRVQR